jgi:hypothetical protein
MKQKSKYWTGAHTKHRVRYHFYGFPNIEKEYFAETVGIQDDAVMKLCGLIFYNF